FFRPEPIEQSRSDRNRKAAESRAPASFIHSSVKAQSKLKLSHHTHHSLLVFRIVDSTPLSGIVFHSDLGILLSKLIGLRLFVSTAGRIAGTNYRKYKLSHSSFKGKP